MGKKSQKNRSYFREALTMAPGLSVEQGTAKLHDLLDRLKNTGSIRKIASSPFWNRAKEEAEAGFHDFTLILRRAAGNFFSLPARIIYLSVALAIITISTFSAVQIALNTMHKYGRDLSNPAYLMNEKNTGTTIVDRNGEVLFQGYGAVDRHSIPFEEMPDNIKNATVAVEDPSFYSNPGFSWKGTARAAYKDVLNSGKIEGGSTITQQLVKNTLLDNEKSFTRKYKEILLSVELDRRYSKDRILQMYLNTIYYGQGAYGIEAASETYFHKPARDLNLQESALLAGLPQSPSRYDPNLNMEAAKHRRDFVLKRMEEQGKINHQQAQSATAAPIQAGTRALVIKSPHFVFYVLNQLRQQYGNDIIEHGGITVHTTLDYAKQQKAEEIVRTQVSKLASHNATNGGLVSIDPRNGDIISMVGSVDYNQPRFGNVNVTLAQLQPGSSFKPIAYATAFEKGWNGATVVEDKPLHLPGGNGSTYSPQNYDQKFRGPVTLRRALANSLNIPAVEVLQHAGLHDTITLAHSLGIQEPSLSDESRYGLSLVLGGGEVRPIDMARSYATFANAGRSVTPRAIERVDNKFANDITVKPPRPNPDTKPVIDPRIAYMLTNILSDNEARKEEFGENSPLKLSRPAAAKTGTTNDFRDNWTVGYTPNLVTAVWVGNNDHSPMNNVDGITGAAPIWHDYMEMAHANIPAQDFKVPAGVVFAKVCKTDGGLAPSDPGATNEVFLAESVPTKACGSNGGGAPKPKSNSQPAQPSLAATPSPTVTAEPPAPGSGSGPPTQDPNPPNTKDPNPPSTKDQPKQPPRNGG